MTDKLRDEFEAHYAKEFAEVRGYEPSAEEMLSMREGEGYGSDRGYLNGYWKGWQASRKNIQIELPKPFGADRLVSKAERYTRNQAIDQMQNILEEAGLKVKPC